jgi:predicted secreted protein
LGVAVAFTDKRRRKIVFVSQCILNQNLRFAGIAVAGGACVELVGMLMHHEIGIETLPCLERLGWGGVARRRFFRYQPLFSACAVTPLFGLVRPLGRLWLWRYGLLCRHEAGKVARDVADYVRSGYSVIGIVGVNDSPTDGVTRTIDLIESAQRLAEMGLGGEVFARPEGHDMKRVVAALCEAGSGIFTRALFRALKKRGIAVPIVDYDPWAEQATETARLARALRIRERGRLDNLRNKEV